MPSQSTCEKLICEKREVEASMHAHAVKSSTSDARISTLTEKVEELKVALGKWYNLWSTR